MQIPILAGGMWTSATLFQHWCSWPAPVLLKSVKARRVSVGGGVSLASMTVGAALAKRAMEMAEARVVKETISLELNDVVWKFVEKYLERWSWMELDCWN